MLSVRRLSVCLFVMFVHCGHTEGRIKTKLGMHVGLGPGHIVLDGEPAPSPPKGHSPNFRLISVAAKWLHGSRCHLVWLVSDIAIFVLKRDVKLQLTNLVCR